MGKNTQLACIVVSACTAAVSCSRAEQPKGPARVIGTHVERLGVSTLQVGVARVDITPQVVAGVDLSGYGQRQATGVHDPVTARCLIVDDIAFIALDQSNLPYAEVKQAASVLQAVSGISPEHLFFHATHTHSAPSPEYYGSHPAAYEELLARVVECLTTAQATKREATAVVGAAVAAVDTVNREHPEREVRNIVNVVEFRDASQQVVSVLVSFACHPVVLGPDNTLISADYVNDLRAFVERARGGTTVFVSGALGDINPPPIRPEAPGDRTEGSFAMAQDLGYRIGEGVLRALGDATPLPLDRIDIVNEELELLRGPTAIVTKLSMLGLGELRIVTIPGEPFSTFQQELETSLPDVPTLFFGLTHDRLGYIVPESDWASFRLHRPEEAAMVDETWASILESEYVAMAGQLARQEYEW
jgi:neutral ceramidase